MEDSDQPKTRPLYSWKNRRLVQQESQFGSIDWKLSESGSRFSIHQSTAVCLYRLTCVYIDWLVSIPTDVCLYRLTCVYIDWCLSLPTDVYLYRLTCVYIDWRVSILTDVCLYRLTCVYIDWRVSISTDVCLYRLTCVYIDRRVSISTDVFLYRPTCVYIDWRVSISIDVCLYRLMYLGSQGKELRADSILSFLLVWNCSCREFKFIVLRLGILLIQGV